MAKKLLKDRLKEKREELKSRGQSGDIIFLKPDKTLRVRILQVGPEEEFIKEVVQFYLGNDIKGVISPATFGQPCGIMESYEELKNSNDDDDKTLAKSFSPKQKYLAYVAIYKDVNGKELDEENSPKFVLLTSGMYEDILDLYLDESEWGDMTRPNEEGYDLKLSRTGSGKLDTEYSVSPCKNTPAPKQFRNKVFDLEAEVRKIMPSYEETKRLIAKFLGLSSDEEEESSSKKAPKKKLLKKSDL